MKIQWQKTIFKISLWLLVEICLNFLGLDDLADYSEFIFERHVLILSGNVVAIEMTISNPLIYPIIKNPLTA